MDQAFLESVLELYKECQWKDLLELNRNSDNASALKILWVWPSIQNVYFIKRKLRQYKLEGITSVGCGSGLLEWCLSQATGLPVVGYEINQEWWTSKYSCPQFINLQYSNENPHHSMLNPKYALLFCYFNNGPAFIEYVKCFKGQVIIIIGPGQGKGRHTDPEPFNPNFGSKCWSLCEYDEIKESKDFIAVYVRRKL